MATAGANATKSDCVSLQLSTTWRGKGSLDHLLCNERQFHSPSPRAPAACFSSTWGNAICTGVPSLEVSPRETHFQSRKLTS